MICEDPLQPWENIDCSICSREFELVLLECFIFASLVTHISIYRNRTMFLRWQMTEKLSTHTFHRYTRRCYSCNGHGWTVSHLTLDYLYNSLQNSQCVLHRTCCLWKHVNIVQHYNMVSISAAFNCDYHYEHIYFMTHSRVVN